MKRLSIDDLKELMIEFQKQKTVNDKQALIVALVFTVMIFGGTLLLINYYDWISQRINLTSQYDDGMFVVIMIIVLMLFILLYGLFMSRRNNGRSVFTFEHNCESEQEINDKMEKILIRLMYKEKTIKKEKVYYAYKNSYSSINSRSEKRCIKYSIEDNKVVIYAWALVYGKEMPIDKSLIGFPIKDTLLHDLYQIYNYIND